MNYLFSALALSQAVPWSCWVPSPAHFSPLCPTSDTVRRLEWARVSPVRGRTRPGFFSLCSSPIGGGGEENALLLRVDFLDTDIEEIRHWVRRYPYGAALPVQPYSIMETEEGLNLLFRKKPTLERSGEDGGLEIVITEDTERTEGKDESGKQTLTLRRIAQGQQIRKIFAERIVVKALVASLGEWMPPDKVRSVLHENMLRALSEKHQIQ